MAFFSTEGNGAIQSIATAVTTMIVTSSFASIRICTRACLKRNWNVGDWLFIVSQISYLILTSGVIAGALAGYKALSAVTLDDISSVLQWWFICELLYTVCIAFLRASIGLLLIGICQGIERRYAYIIYATIGLHTATAIATIIYLLAQCHPIAFYWRQVYGVPGHCVNPRTFGKLTTLTAANGAITDAILAILPFLFLWKLRMEFKTKLSVQILLSLGLITSAVCIIRTIMISKTVFNLDQNFFANTGNVATLSMLEPAVGICCAAASTFRPLFQRWEERSRLVQPVSVGRSGLRMSKWYKMRGYRQNSSEPGDIADVTV